MEDPTKFIEFEKPVVVEKNQKYINGYISSTKILIEQKGSRVKLGRTAVQSDGEKLTPYGQDFRYNNYLPYDQKAKWIVISNFTEILIYDMNKLNCEPEQIFLKDLPKEYFHLKIFVDTKSEIDALKTQNQAYLTLKELQAAKAQTEEVLKRNIEDILREIENELNTKMKAINDSLFSTPRKPPHIHFNKQYSYKFETPDDTGTGSNFNGMIVFDLAYCYVLHFLYWHMILFWLRT